MIRPILDQLGPRPLAILLKYSERSIFNHSRIYSRTALSRQYWASRRKNDLVKSLLDKSDFSSGIYTSNTIDARCIWPPETLCGPDEIKMTPNTIPSAVLIEHHQRKRVGTIYNPPFYSICFQSKRYPGLVLGQALDTFSATPACSVRCQVETCLPNRI